MADNQSMDGSPMNNAETLLLAEGSLQSHISSICSASATSAGAALRHLSYLAELLAEEREHIDLRLLEAQPELPAGNWGNLIRAFLGHTMGSSAPPWMRETEKLPEPWYPSRYNSLRKAADETSPSYLRDLNIFIDAKSLTRI